MKKATALVREGLWARPGVETPRLRATARSHRPKFVSPAERARALADAGRHKDVRLGAQLGSGRAWLVSAGFLLLEGDSSTAYGYATRAESSQRLSGSLGEDNTGDTGEGLTFKATWKQLRQLLEQRRSFHAQETERQGQRRSGKGGRGGEKKNLTEPTLKREGERSEVSGLPGHG
jgi:hypothetical protein